MTARGIVAAVVVLAILGCGATGDPAAQPPRGEEAVETRSVVHDDLETLRRRIVLPSSATAATWSETPLGNPASRAPGPTDTRIQAFVTIDPDGWDAVDALYGPPRPPQRDTVLSVDQAEPLIPEAMMGQLEPVEGQVTLITPAMYRPIKASQPGWGVGVVVRVADAGLWIEAVSM